MSAVGTRENLAFNKRGLIIGTTGVISSVTGVLLLSAVAPFYLAVWCVYEETNIATIINKQYGEVST